MCIHRAIVADKGKRGGVCRVVQKQHFQVDFQLQLRGSDIGGATTRRNTEVTRGRPRGAKRERKRGVTRELTSGAAPDPARHATPHYTSPGAGAQIPI